MDGLKKLCLWEVLGNWMGNKSTISKREQPSWEDRLELPDRALSLSKVETMATNLGRPEETVTRLLFNLPSCLVEQSSSLAVGRLWIMGSGITPSITFLRIMTWMFLVVIQPHSCGSCESRRRVACGTWMKWLMCPAHLQGSYISELAVVNLVVAIKLRQRRRRSQNGDTLRYFRCLATLRLGQARLFVKIVQRKSAVMWCPHQISPVMQWLYV